MRIPGLKTAKITAEWLVNRLFPGAVILGYHRIASEENDSFYNCVAPNHFSEQMEILSRYANPISLEDLSARLELGDPLPKTACVTFDDGYLDTLINAKPILEKYEIPATVFVTTGSLGSEFWWDELERYILEAPKYEKPIRLRINEQELEWNFTNLNATERASQIVSIANSLRPLKDTSRHHFLNKIKEWAGINDEKISVRVRCMTPDELVSLTGEGIIQIGSHSITHPVLSNLSESERRYEMEESKRLLEEIVAQPILGFSYPNGRYLDSDPDLVCRSGYRYACASINGTVRATNNHFKLPRFWIGNIDGESFLKWLKRWL
jgi:peptidoglycan/xylan/chitin deacetylase (PgdA/CDA1 family)